MNQSHIQKIAVLLELSGSVPLPGGQGTHFLQIRKACKDYKEAPGVVGRCYVCLAMLGDSQARRQDSAMERELTKYKMGSPNGFEEGKKIERWNRVHWVQYASAWFDQQEWTEPLDQPRWQYLLAAMVLVVTNWCGKIAVRQQVRMNAENWAQAATEALKRQPKKAVPTVPRTSAQRSRDPFLSLVVPRTSALGSRDPLWDTAREELLGLNGAIVQMLYFMHVLHSSLGIQQPPLDVHYRNRREFYSCLVQLLQASAGSCQICTSAREIAKALAHTAMLLPKETMPIMRTEILSSRLPECFRPNLHRASPPFLDFVQIWVGDEQAARLLRQAHLLAETVADVLIDPFHIRAEDDVVPGFKAESYVYLDSRIRGEYRKRKAQFKCRVGEDTTWGSSNASDIEDDREAIEDDQEAIEPDGVLAEALHGLLSGDLANHVHTYLPHVFQAQWSPDAPSSCAMCHINTKHYLVRNLFP